MNSIRTVAGAKGVVTAFPARERPPAGAGGTRLEAAHSVPPEIRTCDRRSGKLTQSCRPFRTNLDYPFGLLWGTERSQSWAPSTVR
jgi:hypothetical protein